MACAWALDALISEPRHYHPLCLFGAVAERLEQQLNQQRFALPNRKLAGAAALALLLVPTTVVAAWLIGMPHGWLAELLILYFCLGAHSLGDHARAVVKALRRGFPAGELSSARKAVSSLVSRDTQRLQYPGIAAAATESVLENGNDAVFATLFWFMVAGAPGALAHRLVNTLDAMWGYRNPRFTDFGWAAARLDDLLGWLPARLSALTYALLSGRPVVTLRRAREQAHQWPGTNPGIVLASGALALGTRLGGPTPQAGPRPAEMRQRPWLGEIDSVYAPSSENKHCPSPDDSTIIDAWRLLSRGVWLWLGIAIISSTTYAYIM